MKKLSAAILVALSLVSLPASASLWNWKINNTTGTFLTTGSGYAAGSYSLIDFSVTTSGDGMVLGSVSGGQYAAKSPLGSTLAPYDFNWDGSNVTFWGSAGTNLFDWWVFDDLSSTKTVLFAWGTGNVNDPSQGALYDTALGCCSQPSYLINVSAAPVVSAVPEPESVAMLSAGLLLLAAFRRRHS